MSPANYDKNVFINCPFDADYDESKKALIFTVVYCGLNPRIASERGDSGEVRINKIKTLLSESKYSIHDLSRIEPKTVEDLPRFNMPFELGIDIGFKEFRDNDKKMLVLEKEKYRYHKFISDIAGNDIKNHDSSPEKIVNITRNWLRQNVCPDLPSGSSIWYKYREFSAYFKLTLKEMKFTKNDIKNMPINEYVDIIKLWKGKDLHPPKTNIAVDHKVQVALQVA